MIDRKQLLADLRGEVAARTVAKHLVDHGELVTTGQKRGTRYQLPGA